jgi:hypothetical protein
MDTDQGKGRNAESAEKRGETRRKTKDRNSK